MLHWYKVAAKQGDKVSQFQIGRMCHLHTLQIEAWREQARAMIDGRGRREAVVTARRDSARLVAELKRRAGLVDARRTETAVIEPATILH